MIQAVFSHGFQRFTLSGHAGYAEAGEDIVCSAVSAMTNLVCNAAEAFGAGGSVQMNEEDGFLSYQMTAPNETACRLLSVFHDELLQLEHEYPDHVRVKKI